MKKNLVAVFSQTTTHIHFIYEYDNCAFPYLQHFVGPMGKLRKSISPGCLHLKASIPIRLFIVFEIFFFFKYKEKKKIYIYIYI